MISDITTAALGPFTDAMGWQAFAYGVTGRIIVKYAKNFVQTISPSADEAVANAEEEIDETTGDK